MYASFPIKVTLVVLLLAMALEEEVDTVPVEIVVVDTNLMETLEAVKTVKTVDLEILQVEKTVFLSRETLIGSLSNHF
jgi:hypothetical protein